MGDPGEVALDALDHPGGIALDQQASGRVRCNLRVVGDRFGQRLVPQPLILPTAFEAAGDRRIVQTRFARLDQRLSRRAGIGAVVVKLAAFAIEEADGRGRFRVDRVQARRHLVVDRVARTFGDVATVAVDIELVQKPFVDAQFALQLGRCHHPHLDVVASGLQVADQLGRP